MPLSERDAACLWDMLDASTTVRKFVLGVTFERYLEDRKLQLAIERLIEIIGEASSRSDTYWRTNTGRSSMNAYGSWRRSGSPN